MVTCAACGADNPGGHRFCGQCGTALAAACPSCGTAVEPDQRFCGLCGTPLDVAATRAAPPAASAPMLTPIAERRVCSVLFADLVGFTPISEARDPEEIRELLSRYFEVARTVIARYGGVVEKFIGDAVMAVWGTPVAGEGDAERAVRAALDVVDAVAALGIETGIKELAARAGVVTGEVAVTVGAQQEGMVAGDAVNTAARVQSVAQPGTVLVDRTTRRLAAAAVGFDDAGAHTLKGKAEPEPLWQATRVLAGVGGNQRIDGLEAPLTGRDAEVRLIRELFHSGADRKSSRLVVVSGAAGVGKSRLGWEFEKYIDGLAQTMWWHRGRCLSYGEGVAFWALAQAIRQRLNIAEEDATDVASQKITDGLAELLPNPEERDFVAVRIGRLLGAPVPSDAGGQLAREELFAGWRMLFERMAAIEPVVWLVEDAHHADTGLLDFVDHLVDWARDLPIFVLVLSRSELTETRPGFGVGRNRTLLALDPLDAASMDSLVDALVPGMPEAARSAITDHAQGVPLFAVETIRSLVDRDVVQPIDGVYRLVGEVGALAVPDSLHGLLAARLDALDPTVRALVADAAVLGTSFPAEALIAVSDQDEAAVRAGLEELVRREVFEVSADTLSPERGSYHFAQQLLRQVAYDTLSRRDRKARHLIVAAHLRTNFADDGEEVADAIARHYRDALDAVPDDPDVEAVRAEAIAMSGRAGRRALRAGSPVAAADAFVQAAGLARDADLDEEADWWERAADAADVAGRIARAVEHARQARDLHLSRGQTLAAARAQTIMGRNLSNSGRLSEGRVELSAAVEILRQHSSTDTVRALAELSGTMMAMADEASLPLALEAIDLAEAIGADQMQVARTFTFAGLASAATNRLSFAAAMFDYAARIAEQAGDRYQQSRALLNLADTLGSFDPKSAAAVARQSLAIARMIGASSNVSIGCANLCETLLVLGEWDEVEALLSDVEADPDDPRGFYLQTSRAMMYCLRGDAARAAEARELSHGQEPSEDPQDRATHSLTDAAGALAAGDARAGLRFARAALAEVDGLGIGSEPIRWAWLLAAQAARALDDAAALTELVAMVDGYPVGHIPPTMRADAELVRIRLGMVDPDEVAEILDRSIATLRDVPAPYHLAWTLLERGTEADVAEALAIGERLGAKPLIERATEKAVQPA